MPHNAQPCITDPRKTPTPYRASFNIESFNRARVVTIESAAHLVDHVLPEQPIRQWVLTFPFPLRFLFAAQPQVLSQVLGVVYRAISAYLIKKVGFAVTSGAKTGAVTLIQRFGSALNLNVHFHMLFLDGAYSFDSSRPRFHRAPRPTPTELAQLLHRISQRVARLLERQGLLVRDPDHAFLDFEPGGAFDQLVGASIHYRIAIGPNAGKKALTLRTVPAQPEPSASTLLAKQPGFSLHTATCCEASQRDRLEKLCRSPVSGGHHPAGDCQRAPLDQRTRADRLQVQAAVPRWHHPYRPRSSRLHRSPRSPGSPPKTQPHPVPRGVRPELQAS